MWAAPHSAAAAAAVAAAAVARGGSGSGRAGPGWSGSGGRRRRGRERAAQRRTEPPPPRPGPGGCAAPCRCLHRRSRSRSRSGHRAGEAGRGQAGGPGVPSGVHRASRPAHLHGSAPIPQRSAASEAAIGSWDAGLHCLGRSLRPGAAPCPRTDPPCQPIPRSGPLPSSRPMMSLLTLRSPLTGHPAVSRPSLSSPVPPFLPPASLLTPQLCPEAPPVVSWGHSVPATTISCRPLSYPAPLILSL